MINQYSLSFIYLVVTNKEGGEGGARGEGKGEQGEKGRGSKGEGIGEPLSSPFKGGGLLERRGLLKSGGVIWNLRYFHIIFIPLRFFHLSQLNWFMPRFDFEQIRLSLT